MSRTSVYLLCAVSIYLIVSLVNAAPQGPPPDEKPEPYEYSYKVEDAPTNLYFGANEAGNEAGRVDGSYYVWLPDGRLMTVTYYVDGESGFVPKITYQENANPIGSAPAAGR
ncbi:hypothetical protein O3M35_001187 [Rhynocoris fuscipes]|uniref:Pro-resilin n=1 Tax=Rhynocoris fuscipes TaxID=488301 RepID=A0AAW1DR97_9HEMI